MQPVYTLEGSVRSDVAALRADAHVRASTRLYGLLLDTATGALREVCRDEGGGGAEQAGGQ